MKRKLRLRHSAGVEKRSVRRAAMVSLAVLALGFAACSSSEPSVPTPGADVTTRTVTVTAGGGATSGPTGATRTQEPEHVGEPAVVTRVIDGDTVEVEFEGETLDIRLIGIDTPETVDPSEPVECYGPAASRFTTRMLEGQEVQLEFDIELLDRYDRTLAYVWLGDELFNEVLVARGFAQVSTYPPNVKYVDRFLAAQREARSNISGAWGPGCEVKETAGGGGGGGKNCDPSYSGACIAPYPPDLDCGDVSATNFAVTGSDPHGFDGDRDGVGCES
jgi:micrococcal nuclease